MTGNLHQIGVNKDRAKDFYIQAEIEFNQNNWPASRKALQACLNYDPTYQEAYELACHLYLKVGQAPFALKILEDYAKILPAPTQEFYLLQAKAFLQEKKLDECKAALEECFNFKRDYEPALLILADYYFFSQKYPEAIAIYERMHDKDKGNKDILYSLANAYFKQKEWDGAIIYCSKLLDAKVDHPAVIEIYKKSLEEKKRGLKGDKNRTFLQNLFAFIYDPETEKHLKIHSEQEWKLKKANEKGYLDEKTGILNFQALKDSFPVLAQGSLETLFIGFLDINYFKFYNDYYGSHAVGDLVLKALGKVGNEIFPQWFFRRSGDEFIFVFQGEAAAALHKAELFRQTAETQAMAFANEMIQQAEPPLIDKKTQKPYCLDRKITVSIGMAQYNQDGRDLITVLESAEKNFAISHDGRKNAVVFEGKIVSSGEIPDKPIVGAR
jgi:diguanylate cyclase (GGDEF)-like protein